MQASWNTEPTSSHVFGAAVLTWALKNSAVGKSWMCSSFTTPHKNLETAGSSADSGDESKVNLAFQFQRGLQQQGPGSFNVDVIGTTQPEGGEAS